MLFISPDNEYPRHIGDIQLAYPNYKHGDVLPTGWRHVAEAPRPDVAEDELTYEDTPAEIDGVLSQNWKVRKLTVDELAVRNAPKTAKEKLIALGLTENEVRALALGLVR